MVARPNLSIRNRGFAQQATVRQSLRGNHCVCLFANDGFETKPVQESPLAYLLFSSSQDQWNAIDGFWSACKRPGDSGVCQADDDLAQPLAEDALPILKDRGFIVAEKPETVSVLHSA